MNTDIFTIVSIGIFFGIFASVICSMVAIFIRGIIKIMKGD